LLLLAVATVPLILAPALPVAIALGGLAGLPWAPVFSSQYTLVGAVTLPGTVTEAFAWNTSAWAGGVAAGSALAGAIVERERRRRVDRGRVHLLRADGHGRRRQAGASRCSVGKLDLEHAFRLVGVPPERVNVW